ncbi:hypothetical protein APHAL10511_004893 [Amanita phalloides]|nr:hypothetical protein APHAL10511_004893 [Amanita phalloides]
MLDLIALVLFLASLAFSLAVAVPLTGVLVRYRANYNPKGLQLDAEGGAQPYAGPIIRSYFTMFGRVYRIEGVAGLYKGLMPTTFSTLFVSTIILMFLDAPKPRHGTYKAPDAGILGTLIYSFIMMLLALPTVILTYRSITTPHRLTYFNLMHSLRILLTPTERRRPWVIYLTPGLLSAEILHLSIVVLGLAPLRRLLLPALRNLAVSLPDVPTVKVVIYCAMVTLVTLVLSPLEVISTRLAIQRNHASAEFNSVSQEVEGDAEDAPEYGGEEDVIGLRNEADPYLGLVDCANRIIKEEGWSALYRAWWLTLLGALASTL